MIKHIWSIICRRSIVDSNTNNLTISDVLEQLNIDIKVEEKNAKSIQSINLPLEFEIVSFWLKEEEKSVSSKGDCEITVISPTGKTLQTFKQLVHLPSDMRRLRTILRVMGLTLENSGDYIIKVSLKKGASNSYKTVAELPLEVHLNKNVTSKLAVS